MSISDISRKTRIFDDPFVACEISWRSGEVVEIRAMDEEYFEEDASSFDDIELDGEVLMHRNDEGRLVENATVGYQHPQMLIFHGIKTALPTEFFTHQLMDVDSNNDESVLRFVQEFGFPYSPLRNEPKWPVYAGISRDVINEHRKAVEATNKLEYFLTKAEDARRDDGSSTIGSLFSGMVISKREAAFTIRLMQSVSEFIQTSVIAGESSSEDKSGLLQVVNFGACNPLYASGHSFVHREHSGGNLHEYGMLTSAICNQIIETLADDAPWRMCACEGCGKAFKRKQSTANGTHSNDSIYCCKLCEERQKKRNQRKAAKERIKH